MTNTLRLNTQFWLYVVYASVQNCGLLKNNKASAGDRRFRSINQGPTSTQQKVKDSAFSIRQNKDRMHIFEGNLFFKAPNNTHTHTHTHTQNLAAASWFLSEGCVLETDGQI